MALVKQGSKVTCSINDLPLLDNIRSGDKFVVQTTAGTYLLDFSNFTITLDASNKQHINIITSMLREGNFVIIDQGIDTLGGYYINANKYK